MLRFPVIHLGSTGEPPGSAGDPPGSGIQVDHLDSSYFAGFLTGNLTKYAGLGVNKVDNDSISSRLSIASIIGMIN